MRLGRTGSVKESNIHRGTRCVPLSWKESDAHKLAQKLPSVTRDAEWEKELSCFGSRSWRETKRRMWEAAAREPANWWKEVMLNLCTLNSSDSRPLSGFILHFSPLCFCKQCSLWLECLLPLGGLTGRIASHPLRPWSNITTFLDSLWKN